MMSDPKSTNPLFPNPTVYPEAYQRIDKLKQTKKFNTVMSEYGRGELTSSSGAPVTKKNQAVAIAASESGQSYRDKQRERMKADRFGVRRK